MEYLVFATLIIAGCVVLFLTSPKRRSVRLRNTRDEQNRNPEAGLARQQTEQLHRLNGANGQM